MRRVVSIYEQMGLDAVEIMMGWENAFGIKLSDAEVWELRTPRQAIDLIASKVGASDREPGVFLGLRAYHRIRQAFGTVVKMPRSQIRLDSKLRKLLPKKHPRDTWPVIFAQAGFPESPPWRFGTGVILMPITIRDVVIWLLAHHPKSLIDPSGYWTYRQVRSIVRAVIMETVGIMKFDDNDDFIENMGIN
jgi:hypothetical protein